MANTQNLEINISRIVAGMHRMNEMKDEIRSMTELLTPYLSDMAQAHLTNLPNSQRSGDYIDVIRIADGARGLTLSLRAFFVDGGMGDNTIYFRLEYLDLKSYSTVLLSGSRNIHSNITKSSPMPHQLARENVADCHQAIEKLMKYVAERYPDEMKIELNLYLSLVQ